MKILWKLGKVIIDPSVSAIDRLVSWFWWILQPGSAREAAKEPPWELTILTKRNTAVWILLACWGLYYFTFQFHSSQEPFSGDGPLFTIAPSVFLQAHRHIALDYILSYSWVVIFITVGSLYYFLAITSERDFWRYGLAFWATWITQYTLQRFVNLISPMRDSNHDLAFIREEVFPWSENLVGLKYGAFPSGHIGVTLLVLMIARDRGAPWVQKTALGCLVVMFWSIFYLGEHYLLDALASAILYPSIYLLVTRKILPGKDKADAGGSSLIR